MMGDFSRNTFDPTKHYKGARLQQGRPVLDADWNENLDMLLHRIETETIDVIGLRGFPTHNDNDGFEVVADPKLLPSKKLSALRNEYRSLKAGDFLLTAGRGYVDGIMCEIDETIPYSEQPHVLPHTGPAFSSSSDGTFLVYLDVWERTISALEDPDIREIALGGPDTTVRSKVIWQVKFRKVGGTNANLECNDKIAGWPPGHSTGTLCVRTHMDKVSDDPCSVAPGAGYKRLENQLYRVEIHKSSDDNNGPTFKWSRDNGSVLIKIEDFVAGSADKVRVSSLGRDDALGLHELDWVEVLDDAQELSGEPGSLVQIDKIDREQLVITFKNSISGFDVNLHPKLRRWDSDGELNVESPAENEGYIPLEDGVEVKFNNGNYQTGDYWIIPARTIPGQYGDIEWPQKGNNPDCLLPLGIQHHYCKLALVVVEGGIITEVTDCREKFPPLTELPVGGGKCCSVTVGEGGDFTRLQDAVDARPTDASSWSVCLLPGEHKLEAPVIVVNQQDFTLSGCGHQSFVIAAPGAPILAALDVTTLRLEGLMFQSDAPLGTFLLANCDNVAIHNCRGENQPRENIDQPVLVMLGCNGVEISRNQIRSHPALVAHGRSFKIYDNYFTGGGIQLLFNSLAISIASNQILGGNGPGIQLGGVLDSTDVVTFFKTAIGGRVQDIPIRDDYMLSKDIRESRFVSIINNLIADMEGSGILTLERAFDLRQTGEVTHLEIAHNQIVECATNPDFWWSTTRAVGGGINLSSVFKVTVHGNLVAYNGSGKAACGIIVTNAADVEIANNSVINNGSGVVTDDGGYQSGIAALFVFGNGFTIDDELKRNRFGNPLGMPALRVHGNKVVAPAGLAFTAIIEGTAQVTDNIFVTQGRHEQTPLFEGLEARGVCVEVLNISYQGWLEWFVGTLGAGVHFETGMEVLFQNTPKDIADGRLMFNDNQVTLVFSQPEGEYNPGPLDASVLLFSLDDISFQGNQIQADSTPDWLWVDVLVWGASIRATNNNFSELPGSTFYSYFSQANLMNITTANTAVHCISTTAPQNIEQDNLVLFCE